MILCVTPNVAIDRTLVVPNYAHGGVFRPDKIVVAAGGKGINVARAIKTLGGEPICAGFLAGYAGQFVASLVKEEGIEGQWTFLDNRETRTCTILIDSDNSQTSAIYEYGFTTDVHDWRDLQSDVVKASQKAQYISFSGSLPAKSPLSSFANLLQSLVDANKSVWVDSSGEALTTATQIKGVALKVNHEEASDLSDEKIQTVTHAAHVAKVLHNKSEAPIIITLGKKGAILVNKHLVIHVEPPEIKVESAVASGDSFLAALLLTLETGNSFQDALKKAVAVGTANALSVGGAQFSMTDVEKLYSTMSVQEL